MFEKLGPIVPIMGTIIPIIGMIKHSFLLFTENSSIIAFVKFSQLETQFAKSRFKENESTTGIDFMPGNTYSEWLSSTLKIFSDFYNSTFGTYGTYLGFFGSYATSYPFDITEDDFFVTKKIPDDASQVSALQHKYVILGASNILGCIEKETCSIKKRSMELGIKIILAEVSLCRIQNDSIRMKHSSSETLKLICLKLHNLFLELVETMRPSTEVLCDAAYHIFRTQFLMTSMACYNEHVMDLSLVAVQNYYDELRKSYTAIDDQMRKDQKTLPAESDVKNLLRNEIRFLRKIGVERYKALSDKLDDEKSVYEATLARFNLERAFCVNELVLSFNKGSESYYRTVVTYLTGLLQSSETSAAEPSELEANISSDIELDNMATAAPGPFS